LHFLLNFILPTLAAVLQLPRSKRTAKSQANTRHAAASCHLKKMNAGLAQLVEQLICKYSAHLKKSLCLKANFTTVAIHGSTFAQKGGRFE